VDSSVLKTSEGARALHAGDEGRPHLDRKRHRPARRPVHVDAGQFEGSGATPVSALTISWTKRSDFSRSSSTRLRSELPVPACRDRGDNRFRIAPEIEAGEHDDPLVLIEIEQAKWESTQNRSAYSAYDNLIEARTVRYVGLDAAYLVEKQATQTLTLPFVGSRNVDDFAAGHLAIDDR
jgi:hypothetical protein